MLFLTVPRPPSSTLFPYTTLFRSGPASGNTPISSVPLPSTSASAGEALIPSPTTGSSSRARSEEHTSELQSHSDLVCRLLLEKKKVDQKRRRITVRPLVLLHLRSE